MKYNKFICLILAPALCIMNGANGIQQTSRQNAGHLISQHSTSSSKKVKLPEMKLAQRRGGGSRSSRTGGGNSSEGGEFISGIILICFALPMVWMNERRAVKIDKLIRKGRESCKKDVNTESIDASNDYQLVHCKGQLLASEQISDEKFGLVMDACIQIERMVSVYQIVPKENDDGHTYPEQQWCETKIDHDQNPKEWPVESEDFINDHVSLGNFKLSDQLITDFSKQDGKPLDMAQYSQTVINTSSQYLEAKGYQPFTANGEYFQTRILGAPGSLNQDQVGDVRVSWRIVSAGPATIIAQQIQGESQPTFRQWNPCKIEDEDNEPEITVTCPVFCLCCALIEKLFKEGFKEVIQIIQPGTKSAKQVFDEMEKDSTKATTIFRWVAWAMSVLGHYLLFVPVIQMLAWLPLVGFLLSKILAFAAVLIALVWATLLHFTILAISWILYRPLYALLLLAGVGVCIVAMSQGAAITDTNYLNALMADPNTLVTDQSTLMVDPATTKI